MLLFIEYILDTSFVAIYVYITQAGELYDYL